MHRAAERSPHAAFNARAASRGPRRRTTRGPRSFGAPRPWRFRGTCILTTLERVISSPPSPDQSGPSLREGAAGPVDVWFEHTIRGAFREHARGRGQVWSVGSPHTFVRAGEELALRPGDALANLPEGEALALVDAAPRA